LYYQGTSRGEAGATVASHAYRGPTATDSEAALARVVGPERGAELWAEACQAAGVRAGNDATPDELQRATDFLVAQGGAVATVARAIQIRIRTYERLAARGATAQGAS